MSARNHGQNRCLSGFSVRWTTNGIHRAKETQLNRRRITALVVALVAVGAGTALVFPAAAEEVPPPIVVEVLTPRSVFTDQVSLNFRFKLEGNPPRVISVADPSRTLVARITIQPGAKFPWHTHHGPVIVNVTEGELVYVQAKDCVEHPYAAGTAFMDPGRGNVHTAFNPTDGVTVLVATFTEVPETGPFTITEGVVAPEDCAVEVGTHSH